MVQSQLHDKLIAYLQDAHAMEQNALRMLDSMISTTKDPEFVAKLAQHRQETERHERLLKGRLFALGESRSLTADVTAIAGALLKGVSDQVRGDKCAKNARDCFITEQTEIATYELLTRLAERAGDSDTAAIARQICQDEQRMAEWIASRWDRVIDLTLGEAGIVPATAGSPAMTTLSSASANQSEAAVTPPVHRSAGRKS